jgi:hypothetical protein
MRRRRGGARDGSALKRFFKPLALPLSLLLVSSCFLRPLVMPIDKDTAFASNWTSGILMQSAPSGSGPAALATVMNTLNGYEGDEFDMCRRTNTDAGGTDFWQLARYASGKGYKYEFLSEADSGAIPTPCVARMSPGGAVRAAGSGTSPGAAENADRATPAGSSAGSASGSASGSSSGSSAYYVALLDNKDGKLTVGDPQRGRTELTYDEFLERYPYSGLVLAISSAARPAR